MPGMQQNSIETPDFYSQLSREIIIHLRGGRTQTELSSLLGYSFNQVSKWESGATLFLWQNFIDLNEALQLPWSKNFNDCFAFNTNLKVEERPVFEILSHFFGFSDINEMAEMMHKSRSSIVRLLHDQVKIDFSDVLRVIDQRPFLLTRWLTSFLSVNELPSMKQRFESEMQIYKSVVSLPWTPLVGAALYLDAYKDLEEHSTAWVAKQVGLADDQVEKAIEKLVESEIVILKGKKYHTLHREISMMKVPEFRQVTKFLTDATARSFKTEKPLNPDFERPSLSMTQLHPVSADASRKIAELFVEFHHELTKIIKNDTQPKDHVRAVVIHNLDTKHFVPLAENEKRYS